MREDWSDTSIDAILTSLEDIWPQFKKEVIGPLEILTAKSVPDNAQADFGEIKPKIVKAVRSLRDLKEFGERPLDSQRDINELKRLMNSLFRSMIPEIPRNQTPLSYYSRRGSKVFRHPGRYAGPTKAQLPSETSRTAELHRQPRSH